MSEHVFKMVPALVLRGPNVTHFKVVLALSAADFQFMAGEAGDELVVFPKTNATLEETQEQITAVITPILNALKPTKR